MEKEERKSRGKRKGEKNPKSRTKKKNNKNFHELSFLRE